MITVKSCCDGPSFITWNRSVPARAVARPIRIELSVSDTEMTTRMVGVVEGWGGGVGVLEAMGVGVGEGVAVGAFIPVGGTIPTPGSVGVGVGVGWPSGIPVKVGDCIVLGTAAAPEPVGVRVGIGVP